MSIDFGEWNDFNMVLGSDYAARGYPHEMWTKMRAEDPVYWYDKTNGLDFWCITKHADVTAISKAPEKFISGPRITISHEPEQRDEMAKFPPTLIQMDGEKHRAFRQMIAHFFKPQALKKLHEPIEEIGREIVEKLVVDSSEGQCDFVSEVSAPLPIAVIAWMLGLPREDWNKLFDWTNRIIGAEDPDFHADGKDRARPPRRRWSSSSPTWRRSSRRRRRTWPTT